MRGGADAAAIATGGLSLVIGLLDQNQVMDRLAEPLGERP
jgi:hypothetical protein